MTLRNFVTAAAFIAGVVVVAPVFGQANKWGDLSGQFVLPKPWPAAKALPAPPAGGGCGPVKLVDESLVVNPTNGGVANLVISLRPAAGVAVPIHANFQKALGEKVVLDNRGCRFEPHVAVVRVGQTLVLKNSDATGHNTKADLLENPAFNVILPVNAANEVSFANAERLPAVVSCNIHTWMTSRLVVTEHPYVAVSDADGKFALNNVPAGEWEFKLWHEQNGYVKAVNGAALKKGLWPQTIAAGQNTDVGQLTVQL